MQDMPKGINYEQHANNAVAYGLPLNETGLCSGSRQDFRHFHLASELLTSSATSLNSTLRYPHRHRF